MNQQEYNHLRELGWRRRLTPSEAAELQKYLAANPTEQADWQAESGLNQLLERLPEVPPVASNFTALVLKAVELETAARTREGAGKSWWLGIRNWLPRAAVAGLVAGFIFVGYHHQEVTARAVLARNVAGLAQAVSSDPELMKDFESIRRLNDAHDAQPAADTELLALMR